MGRNLARFVEADQPVRYLCVFDHSLVHCPQCDRMAIRRAGRVTCGDCGYSYLRKSKPDKDRPPQAVMCPQCNRYVGTYRNVHLKRLRCHGCGWTKEPVARVPQPAPPRDHGLRLWLETDFRGQSLWALNEQHLSFLESYVAAGVRETNSFNSTIASRLPAWIKSGKNREDLLRTLAKLRARLP